jgi:hypothetical protein
MLTFTAPSSSSLFTISVLNTETEGPPAALIYSSTLMLRALQTLPHDGPPVADYSATGLCTFGRLVLVSPYTVPPVWTTLFDQCWPFPATSPPPLLQQL